MKGSNSQRGGSLRGSDRSMKSHRRDFDDMVLNQHIAANSNPSVPLHGQYPSHYSSRETGYNSGTEYNTQLNSGGYPRGYLNHDSTIFHQREEVETEIF